MEAKLGSFSVLYLNPPYDSEVGSIDNRRMEYLFLEYTYRPWIERLRKIQQLSRLPLRHSHDFLQEGNYDSPPLPSLLVVFK